MRAKEAEARQRKKEREEARMADDPESMKRYESHLAKRRDGYHKKKSKQEELPA